MCTCVDIEEHLPYHSMLPSLLLDIEDRQEHTFTSLLTKLLVVSYIVDVRCRRISTIHAKYMHPTRERRVFPDPCWHWIPQCTRRQYLQEQESYWKNERSGGDGGTVRKLDSTAQFQRLKPCYLRLCFAQIESQEGSLGSMVTETA